MNLPEFGKNLILNEKLLNTVGLIFGGPAEIFFRPENKEQLKKFIKNKKLFENKLYWWDQRFI